MLWVDHTSQIVALTYKTIPGTNLEPITAAYGWNAVICNTLAESDTLTTRQLHVLLTSRFSAQDAKTCLALIPSLLATGDISKAKQKLALNPTRFKTLLDQKERIRKSNRLLTSLKKHRPELLAVQKEIMNHWSYEDMIYRYYHGSNKTYWIQTHTLKLKALFEAIFPNTTFHKSFAAIIAKGTGHTFQLSHNDAWDKHTLPMLQAFFHCKYMLEMMLKYSKELDYAPKMLPSGWAALLCLYNI